MIDAVGQAISRTPGCVLLDVDAGASTNRTVYTFVGSPEAVIEGALSAARVAGQLIDMSRHTGEPGGGTGAGVEHPLTVVGGQLWVHLAWLELKSSAGSQTALPGWMVVGL